MADVIFLPEDRQLFLFMSLIIKNINNLQTPVESYFFIK